MQVSVSNLLPEEARKPLNPVTIELIARGLLHPTHGIAQRLAIELLQSRTP